MAKLGTIKFDDRILDAIRDQNLAVFAGAGVSMGAPSNLASFWKLTEDIASGTGLAPTAPLDRFLGQLQHRSVAVHERAAKFLSPPESAPNALHRNLLRIFRASERVRIITTNFDLHFETAAKEIFNEIPVVYSAPALPRGYDFNGIVHVHGALPHGKELVLTDSDFGKAYLTEGWARRFLVDVFRRYTVLFIGYSHDDVVMNYLARALPAEDASGRFALTESVGNWDLLGIKPIVFEKGDGPDAYSNLYEAVQKLAGRASRGALDWQTRLAELAGGAPPSDDEGASEIEQALRETFTTRFFVNAARHSEWPKWLDSRKLLDAVFKDGSLDDRQSLLAFWLAEHYAFSRSSEVLGLVANHNLRMNSKFWWAVGREMAVDENKAMDATTVKRWASVLLAAAPSAADSHVLMWIAKRCVSTGLHQLALKVFFRMSESRLAIKPGFSWPDEGKSEAGKLDAKCQLGADQWPLRQVWENLKPHLALIVQPLLSGLTYRMECIHGEMAAWDRASREFDGESFGRSAIEPHEQDRHPKPLDVLIDAARDALELLGRETIHLLDAWVERLVASDVPLLRRLAIHAINVHGGLSPEDRLQWLLDRTSLRGTSSHHEMYRLVETNYRVAGVNVRQAFVECVLTQKIQENDDHSAEERTARRHFEWLSWLVRVKPDCEIASAALGPIASLHPEWLLSDHPDLTHWVGMAEWVGPQSPWSVDELLSKPPSEQVESLLEFKGSRFKGPDRDGMLMAVGGASSKRPEWGFELATELVSRLAWETDLWPALLRGLQSESTAKCWASLLVLVSKSELQSAHPLEIANLLYALARDGGKPFTIELLEVANKISFSLWQTLMPRTGDVPRDDWLAIAINHPAGVVVEFWIDSVQLVLHDKPEPERTLPDFYRRSFEMVIQDSTSNGGLARSVLAGQTAFLFYVDEAWTTEFVIPLFVEADDERFVQAWSGFAVSGRLTSDLAPAMVPAFAAALSRLGAYLEGHRSRFIELYTALVLFHADSPLHTVVVPFFKDASHEDRIYFAEHLGHFLRQMDSLAKKNLWASWLSDYWAGRLEGIPVPLDSAEVAAMLDWLPKLDDQYAAAVLLAIQAPTVRIEHSHILFDLQTSDLVVRFQDETALLLVHLCESLAGYHANDLVSVATRLTNVSAPLRAKLNEALALIGAPLADGGALTAEVSPASQPSD